MSAYMPWRHWSLRTRSFAIALIPLVVLIIATVIVVQAARATAAAEDDVRSGIQVLSDIHALHASLAEAASGVRGYLLTDDKSFLAPYWRAEHALQRRIDRLDQRARDPLLRSSLDEIEILSSQKMADLEKMIASVDQPDASNLETMSSNKKLLDQIRQKIQTMEERERAVIETRERSADKARKANLVLSVVVVILGIGAAMTTATLFSNDLIRRIQILGRNAKLLAQGATPTPLPRWSDELGELGDRLQTASNLLSERAEEAQRAREEAENANRAKTDFLSRISHELRTPLNAILGFSKLMRHELASEQHQRQCQHVIDAGQHLLELVDDVMDISRIETGSLDLNLQPLFLPETLNNTIDLMAIQAANRRVTLTVDRAIEDVFVLADSQRFRQVMINLISNAIKFNVDGGEVRLEVERGPERLRISITDHGCGIHPTDQERLFAPFTRLQSANQTEGTGLGLALSKRLVEAMGGQIGVVSSLGHGSTFWVELPRATTPATSRAGDSINTSGSSDIAVVTRPLSVLYVEDNASNRILVETLLSRRAHCELRTAENAADGLKLFSQWRPGCLLLDLHLPDRSGLEVISELRANYTPEDLKIVVVSADALPETHQKAMGAGADAFLLKPIDAAELYRALEVET